MDPRRVLGSCLAIGAELILIFSATLAENQSLLMRGVILIGALLLIPLLSYNFFWGSNRGHVAHLSILAMVAAYILAIVYRQQFNPITFGLLTLLLLGGMGWIVKKYRSKFLESYKKSRGR